MKVILAVDANWGIGKDNKMLFHLKKDLMHFREETIDNIVIMGRSTYESIGHGLDDRQNIVLTRDKSYKLDDALVFHSKDEIMNYLKKASKKVYVIGGSQIVDLFLADSNEAIITKIQGKRDADTYLHNFDEDPDFEIVDRSEILEENGTKFSYVKYRRI